MHVVIRTPGELGALRKPNRERERERKGVRGKVRIERVTHEIKVKIVTSLNMLNIEFLEECLLWQMII